MKLGKPHFGLAGTPQIILFIPIFIAINHHENHLEPSLNLHIKIFFTMFTMTMNIITTMFVGFFPNVYF